MKLQNRDLEPQPGRTLMESFEAGVNQARTHGLHRSHRRFGGVSGLLPEGGSVLTMSSEDNMNGCAALLDNLSPLARMEAPFIPLPTELCERPTARRGAGAGGACDCCTHMKKHHLVNASDG